MSCVIARLPQMYCHKAIHPMRKSKRQSLCIQFFSANSLRIMQKIAKGIRITSNQTMITRIKNLQCLLIVHLRSQCHMDRLQCSPHRYLFLLTRQCSAGILHSAKVMMLKMKVVAVLCKKMQLRNIYILIVFYYSLLLLLLLLFFLFQYMFTQKNALFISSNCFFSIYLFIYMRIVWYNNYH